MDGLSNVSQEVIRASSITETAKWKMRCLFADSCSSYGETAETKAQLQRISTTLSKLPSNATDLMQPTNAFVLRNIKEVWRQHWDKY